MLVIGQIEIQSSAENVWNIISAIDTAATVFRDVKSIEILDKPQDGLVGLKWKEVRVFMGKEAAETMWITEATKDKSYSSQAINSGNLYHSAFIIEESNGGVIVTKTFESTPQSLLAKLMVPLMLLMKGTLKKCLERDLIDLKTYLEAK